MAAKPDTPLISVPLAPQVARRRRTGAVSSMTCTGNLAAVSPAERDVGQRHRSPGLTAAEAHAFFDGVPLGVGLGAERDGVRGQHGPHQPQAPGSGIEQHVIDVGALRLAARDAHLHRHIGVIDRPGRAGRPESTVTAMVLPRGAAGARRRRAVVPTGAEQPRGQDHGKRRNAFERSHGLGQRKSAGDTPAGINAGK